MVKLDAGGGMNAAGEMPLYKNLLGTKKHDRLAHGHTN